MASEDFRIPLLDALVTDEPVNANYVLFNLRLLECYDPDLGYAAVKSAELEHMLGLCGKTVQKYKSQSVKDGLWEQTQKGSRGRYSHLRPLFLADGDAR